jgi:signal transduction histidine kinase
MASEMQDVRPSPRVGLGCARAGPGRAGPDFHVYPRPVRRAGWGAVGSVTLVVWWLTRSVEGEDDYLTAWVLSGAVLGLPGLALTWWSGSHVAEEDRRVWRLWFVGYGITVLGCAALLTLGTFDRDWARGVWLASVVLSIVAFGAGNTLIMRSRAGHRATAPDVLDLASLGVAVVAPVALAVGDTVVRADEAWFVLSWAAISVALVHGVAVAAVLVARIRPEDRELAWLGVVLGVAVLVEAAGQVEVGVSGFQVGAGPVVAWHALACGIGVGFVLHAMRRPSAGLDRLPPQGQVRRTNVVSLLVLAAVLVLVVEAVWWRDRPWVLLGATLSTAALLVLSSLRHLLVARETARLYGLVEQAAAERRQLLADVLSHVDADRHRVATRLHQQAMSSYSAMASFVAALEMAPASPPAAALAVAAAQARTDLAEQVDTLRDVLTMVAPPSTDGPQRLVAPLRAYVDSLYHDGCRPDLEIAVADDVVPDWTTEVVALRIAQAAIANAHRHAECDTISVRVETQGRALVVEVEDDGLGFDPAVTTAGSGIATMRLLAGCIQGDVEVASEPGSGTRVRAVLGSDPPSARPDLRVIPGEG